jgi:hypothetical protein
VRNASQRRRWSKLREWLAVGAAAFGSEILAMTHSGHHLADRLT